MSVEVFLDKMFSPLKVILLKTNLCPLSLPCCFWGRRFVQKGWCSFSDVVWWQLAGFFCKPVKTDFNFCFAEVIFASLLQIVHQINRCSLWHQSSHPVRLIFLWLWSHYELLWKGYSCVVGKPMNCMLNLPRLLLAQKWCNFIMIL